MSKFLRLFSFILLLSPFLIKAAIEDSSFLNEGRYALLKDVSLANKKFINLSIQFIPPKGKKVNTASFVKVWEKKQNEWLMVKKYTADDAEFDSSTNRLRARTILENSDSLAAIEVEFIYCNKNGGGQCDMERYLTKIVRHSHSKDTSLNLKLKI